MEHINISSFDKTGVTKSYLIRPEKYRELFALAYPKMIARGAGLSYCNASSSEEGLSIDMSSFNRILNFNPETNNITVESGIAIGDLNNFLISKGWIMPVLPGYPSITVGGCIAFNVHGKSQCNSGNFLDWVEEFTLFHPMHGEITCSRNQNKELFQLTIGGMGLTGVIISATLKLKKLTGNMLTVKAVKANNIYEAVRIMNENKEKTDAIYSYNNFNAKNNSFGKGMVFLQKFTDSFLPVKTKSYTNKLKAPSIAYNLHSKAAINLMSAVYDFTELIKPSVKLINVTDVDFPIYGKEIYYHLFGKRGFREYQVLFPAEKWEPAIEEIQKLIGDSGMAISLGSLKLFKGQPHNLSFAGDGVCITMDVPNKAAALPFLQSLDEITIKQKGIINLSKDSRASAQLVSALFPAYESFKQQIHEFDLNHTFASELSKRIGI